MIELTRGTVTPLTSNPSVESRRPVWSPDGGRVAFTASPREDYAGNVFTMSADGSGLMAPLAESGLNLIGLDWSPDGSRFLYQVITADEKSKAGLWILVRPGSLSVPFRDDGMLYSQATLSPDGRWVAYTSSQSGRSEVYVERFPFPRGAGEAVNRRRHSTPMAPRPNGALLLVGREPIEGRRAQSGARGHARADHAVVHARRARSVRIGGQGRGAIHLPPLYDVAADARFLAAIVQEQVQPRSPVTVSLNATAGLRRSASR